MWQASAPSLLVLAVATDRLEAACVDPRGGVVASATVALPWDDVSGLPSGLLPQALGDVVDRVMAADADGRKRPRSCRVAVDDVWLAIGQVPWSPVLCERQSAPAYVERRLNDLGFDVQAVTVRFDDRTFGEPCLAVGHPTWLLDALRSALAPHGLSLDSVLPVSQLVQRALGRVPAFSGTTLGLIGQRFAALVSTDLRDADVKAWAEEPGHEAASVEASWRRTARRAAQGEPARLPILSLEGSPVDDGQGLSVLEWHSAGPSGLGRRLQLALESDGSLQALDAIAPRARMSPRHWVGAGVTAFALGASAVWLAQAQRAVDERPVSAGPAVVQPASAPWTRTELQRAAAANEAIAQLNLPVAGLSSALLPPRDLRAGVLSLESQATPATDLDAAGRIRVTVETPTGEEMARYVAWLSSRRSFADVWLVRHEIVDSATGPRYRFVAEAKWND